MPCTVKFVFHTIFPTPWFMCLCVCWRTRTHTHPSIHPPTHPIHNSLRSNNVVRLHSYTLVWLFSITKDHSLYSIFWCLYMYTSDVTRYFKPNKIRSYLRKFSANIVLNLNIKKYGWSSWTCFIIHYLWYKSLKYYYIQRLYWYNPLFCLYKYHVIATNMSEFLLISIHYV